MLRLLLSFAVVIGLVGCGSGSSDAPVPTRPPVAQQFRIRGQILPTPSIRNTSNLPVLLLSSSGSGALKQSRSVLAASPSSNDPWPVARFQRTVDGFTQSSSPPVSAVLSGPEGVFEFSDHVRGGVYLIVAGIPLKQDHPALGTTGRAWPTQLQTRATVQLGNGALDVPARSAWFLEVNVRADHTATLTENEYAVWPAEQPDPQTLQRFRIALQQVDSIRQRTDRTRTDLAAAEQKARKTRQPLHLRELKKAQSVLDSAQAELDRVMVDLEKLAAAAIPGAQLSRLTTTQIDAPRLLAEQPRATSPMEARDAADVIERCKMSVVEVFSPSGAGSGFVVAGDLIVTNNHVVDGAVSATIRTANGVELRFVAFAARVPSKDIAVIRVATTLGKPVPPALELAPATDLREGRTVFAIGHPRGLTGTVTRGIISAIRRGSNNDAIRATLGKLGLDVNTQLVQTDAAMTTGNSGGPLIDETGRVVGMNTFRASLVEQGLNFAVGVEELYAVLNGIRPEIVPRNVPPPKNP